MAKGYLGATTYKGYLGNIKMKKGYIGATRVYSAGEVVTYIVDGSVFWQQEYEEGQSVLSPSKTPSKNGYTLAGWSTSSNGDVLSNMVMGESPITLYAIFVQASAWNFGYNGGIQSWTAPITGLYLLTCYGAKGGNGRKNDAVVNNAGQGGKTVYYTILHKGDIIYLVCGGSGVPANSRVASGGYNGGGGGNSKYNTNNRCGGTGGGATHIAKVSGLLANLASKKSDILAIAGGGAGGGSDANGGAGGGVAGANGGSNLGPGGGGGNQSGGGTHSTWGAGESPSFGKGGTQDIPYSGAGGAGLYGGGAGGDWAGGGGGSGYIKSATTTFKGKTYTNTTSQGGNNGNGSASIQFIVA